MLRPTVLVAILAIAATASAQQRAMPQYQMGVLRARAVEAELRMTPDQDRKVKSVLDAALIEFAKAKKAGLHMADVDRIYNLQKTALNCLNEGQRKRFRQISLQITSPSNLTDPAIATEIGLTAKQRTQIQTMFTQSGKEFAERMGKKGARTFADQKSLMAARAEALMTPRQRAKWHAMLGKRFNVDRLTPNFARFETRRPATMRSLLRPPGRRCWPPMLRPQ